MEQFRNSTGYRPSNTFPSVEVATIANGASQSDVIDLGGATHVALEMPSAWTTADLTLLACSTSGGTFVDVYDDAEIEVTIQASTSRVIVIDLLAGALAPLRYIKLRSGTTGTPVTQGAARTINVILKG